MSNFSTEILVSDGHYTIPARIKSAIADLQTDDGKINWLIDQGKLRCGQKVHFVNQSIQNSNAIEEDGCNFIMQNM